MYKRFLTFTLLIFKVLADTELIPNSCIDLEDGEQYVKLLEGDNYPIVKVRCSNGYTMLDYSLDSDIQSYFSSFTKWHLKIAGPEVEDHVNTEEWYIPNDRRSKYLVSDSCDVCDESIQQHGTKNSYYMNANIFNCFTFPRGMPDCDFDMNTYECHGCTTSIGFGTIVQTEIGADDSTDMGACMTWVRESDAEVDRTYDDCAYQTDTGYKPTIGTSGLFCLCVQPSTSQYYTIDSSEITTKQEKLETTQEESEKTETEKASMQEQGWDYQTKYLYATDFAKGTLRIKEPGTYILMEDIEFDWNSADMNDDPNTDGAWWPSKNDDEYPGWGESRDAFFMGYFAGITIESDNVILDLNGYSLSQSQAFFYQQGFFSDIEIQSQPFVPAQGVGFFGSDPVFPDNIVIKNGYLGRASHHCLHGNYNKNLLIENIVCSDFSTHGIQLNGFEDLTIRNVEIGPSNNEQYLASEYTHYRFILQRMRQIIDEYNPVGTIQFADRDTAVTLSDLHEKLQNEMNYAFKYVMLGEEGDESDDEWIEAKKTFINSDGYGYGASIYGLFLSYPGANVLSYHINSQTSSTATLENIYIHDISHKTKEYIGMKTDLRMFVNSFNAPLHIKYLLGDDVYSQYLEDGGEQTFDNSLHYVGNILTDVTIAMHEFSPEWGPLQIMYLLSDELVAWAKGEDSTTALGDASNGEITYMCAVDGMIHAAKGTFGLRLDGVENVEINNLVIENIAEHSPLGTDICGTCTKCAFEARTPYLIGYGGNMAQGISADYATNLKITNLEIRNVESKTGVATGFSIWPGSDITLDGVVTIENIQAGAEVEKGTLHASSRPNAAPESCGIRVYDSSAYKDHHNDNDLSTVTLSESANVVTSCVEGHTACWASTSFTQVGDYQSCDESTETSSEDTSSTLLQIKKKINIATHTLPPKKTNFLLPTFIFAGIIVYCIIVYFYITRCVINKHIDLVPKRQEIIPLLTYGSIQRN